MGSISGNGSYKNEIQVEEEQADSSGSTESRRLGDFIPIYVPAVEEGVIDQTRHERRFLDFLRAHPSKDWFLKSGFVGRLSPFSFLRRNPNGQVADTDAPPDQPPSPTTTAAATAATTSTDGSSRRRRRRFRVPFVRRINWKSLMKSFKNWMKDPANVAMFLWLVAVVATIILLALVMLGILNDAIPSSSRRKDWTEVINQILNALFMIMCLYQHPRLFHHLVLALRWEPEDRVELRKLYCKDGAPRPHERAHLLFVISLLHITCASQYLLCGLFWGYSRKTRPDWALDLGIGVGIAAPIIAGVYTVKSPLGRRYENETEVESRGRAAPAPGRLPDDSELKRYNRRVVVTSPEWIGGLFDCWDDVTVACLSFFCTFCVFGWNMERLGFGNMYVHIFTFILLCIAPFLVFSASALSIDDEAIRYVLAIIGILLCFFGLLYGGYWRIQIRNRFKLPGNPFCCGYPSVTDCMQWFWCWSCSLAQEVRTGNFYDIEDNSFYRSVTKEEDERLVMNPLPREAVILGGSDSDASTVRSQSCPPKFGGVHGGVEMKEFGVYELPVSFERAATYGPLHTMEAPAPAFMSNLQY